MTPIPPLRSSQKAADIDGFFKLVDQALDLHIKTTGAPEGAVPVYVHSFPKERVGQKDQPFDVITHHVMEGGMAATSNDGSRVPRGPVLRDRRAHPEKDGYNLCVNGWWEDAAVVFTVWSRNSEVADRMTVWFHKFIMRYANFYDFFKARGVQQFRFVKRLEDGVEDREGQELHHRRLVYSFRIEYLDTFEERQLTSVSVNVKGCDPVELSAE